jgi:hypothetical protein
MNSYTFTPTYLYIKQHSVTGKLYFGKTVKDPESYLGSGTHWMRHIKKHGKEHVVTLWYCLFLDQESCTEFALLFSKQENIVESDDWLNLRDENGKDGITPGTTTMRNKITGEIGNFKVCDINYDIYEGVTRGDKHPEYAEYMRNSTMVKDSSGKSFRVGLDDPRFVSRELVGHRMGSTQTKETKTKIGNSLRGRVLPSMTESHRLNLGESHRKFRYETPFGNFDCFKSLEESKISRVWIMKPKKIISNGTLGRCPDYPKEWLGKTYEEVGFRKIPLNV